MGYIAHLDNNSCIIYFEMFKRESLKMHCKYEKKRNIEFDRNRDDAILRVSMW